MSPDNVHVAINNCRDLFGDRLGVDPKLETLKIGTNCSERRFEWQLPEFSGWNFGLQWRDGS